MEGIPNALGGGSGFLPSVLKFGIAPSVLGEAATQATQDTAAGHRARPGTELAATILAMAASRHAGPKAPVQPGDPRRGRIGDEEAQIHAFPKERELTLNEYYGGRPVEVDEFGNVLKAPENYQLNRNAIVIGLDNTNKPQRTITTGEGFAEHAAGRVSTAPARLGALYPRLAR